MDFKKKYLKYKKKYFSLLQLQSEITQKGDQYLTQGRRKEAEARYVVNKASEVCARLD